MTTQLTEQIEEIINNILEEANVRFREHPNNFYPQQKIIRDKLSALLHQEKQEMIEEIEKRLESEPIYNGWWISKKDWSELRTKLEEMK